jgi:hypothetical protein
MLNYILTLAIYLIIVIYTNHVIFYQESIIGFLTATFEHPQVRKVEIIKIFNF